MRRVLRRRGDGKGEREWEWEESRGDTSVSHSYDTRGTFSAYDEGSLMSHPSHASPTYGSTAGDDDLSVMTPDEDDDHENKGHTNLYPWEETAMIADMLCQFSDKECINLYKRSSVEQKGLLQAENVIPHLLYRQSITPAPADIPLYPSSSSQQLGTCSDNPLDPVVPLIPLSSQSSRPVSVLMDCTWSSNPLDVHRSHLLSHLRQTREARKNARRSLAIDISCFEQDHKELTKVYTPLVRICTLYT